ncbi:cytochrome b/b6 domain-containing protein [Tuwongella immobilis]|uniref:Cytochrome b561 bacterial/Ni-hydrogenase domain-containing protein n=1 Tax=Tuwongella immobilis TaxID=692036 RepID=A0A6C2YJ77_9BACT|nr:cytochrome b/b6 domain-containing protein [Tuwongella immobilis]VIP01610.1 thiosulfate reductase : Uncharacterized protein OS=Fibrella aestuarina BUZ 2 GN=FAES_3780 PE=4 SV=1: Cytochrom_B_N [Tuwongella immobilis]VTR98919.1 thiosulfate reductase : Uncharacterized protein OS=Fibrella aestuarina BUZ 2 GN=FAES_3780 PE=4 SV=1: Cytochrom_B_N [Tuwongella immobilis]
MPGRLHHKYPLWVRMTHWINGPVLLIMIWSGLLIYWAHDEYAIRIGDFTLVKFFPEWFYRVLHLERQLAVGLAWHFLFMWLFLLNGLVYFGFTFWSGAWRDLIPNRRTPRQALQTVLHDLRIRKEPPEMDGKYNGAQRLAYTGTLMMGIGSIVTGLAIWKPVQLGWITWMLGGYSLARVWHFMLVLGYVSFFLVHITQVIRAGWNHARAMITGYEYQSTPEQSA